MTDGRPEVQPMGLTHGTCRRAVLPVLVALTLSPLAGCASICTSVAETVSDAIICNNECTGGPGEKECLEKCRKRLAAVRAEEEGKKKDADRPRASHEYHPWEIPGVSESSKGGSRK
ncbi:MAG: hypothetical protein V2B18_20355 [Pseudomonadota bacterium]